MVSPFSNFSRRSRRSGFTLLEMVITVFILATMLSVTFPSLLGMRDQNARLQCISNRRQIQAAKDAFALDHLGEGSPVMEDRKAVFRSYFVEGFDAQSFCPVDNHSYDAVYNIYARTGCSVCGDDEMGNAP